MSTLMTKKSEKSKANLLSLNDKCLEKIFGYLYFGDGLNLGKHEDRLDAVFRNAISKGKFKVFSNMENFESIVFNYGPQLSHVAVSSDLEWINLMAEFCAQGKLHTMHLAGIPTFDAGTSTITRSKAMLSQLKILSIVSCQISDINLGRLLAMCPQLEKFVIQFTRRNTMTSLAEMASPNLKSITLVSLGEIERSTLTQFLTRYPNLREFEIQFNYQLNPHMDIICEMLPNLEQIRVNSVDIGPVITLKHLKDLNISLHIDHLAEVNNYFAMSSGLQCLAIYCDALHGQQFDGLIEAICTCPTLQNLSFEVRGPDILENVIKFADSLPSLRSFVLHTTGTYNSDWQQELWLKFIEKANKLVKLQVFDRYGVYSRLSRNQTEFAEKLRAIVGRREQSHRQLEFNVNSQFSFQCTIRGSRLVCKRPLSPLW